VGFSEEAICVERVITTRSAEITRPLFIYMENQTQTNQNLMLPSGKPKSKYWKFVIAFLAIVILAGGGYFIWDKYFSPEAKLNRQNAENYQKYLDWQANYEKAMREDTYGGKTPEETLKMFIDALKKEDVELASKYFILRLDGSVDPKWAEGLEEAKQAGKLFEIISILSNAKAAGSVMEGYFGFEVRNKNNELIADINMRLNKYSGIWKIESL
jgi:hypothetical protein